MDNISVSVVVPIYNCSKYVIPFLEALAIQNCKKEVEVIFVDNGSTDNCIDILTERISNINNYKLIRENDIKGSYAARNKGINISKGHMIAFTDIDCKPMQTWIDRCKHHAKIDNQSTLISGPISFFWKDTVPNIYEIYDSVCALKQENYILKGYAATANLLVPKNIFNKIGLFKPVNSGGDQEFCLRALRSGFDIKFDNLLKIDHPARSCFSELKIKARRIGKGKAENYYNLKTARSQRILYFIRQCAGLLFPRRQLYIMIEVIHHYPALSFIKRLHLIYITIYLGIISRVNTIKNILMFYITYLSKLYHKA